MRKRFEQQLSLGRLPIQDTVIPTQKRSGALPALCAALKKIFVTKKWNNQVFEILENEISKSTTGRPAMDYWQLFVLAQVRLCQNLSYDNLHHIANHDSLIRQLMGVATSFEYEEVKIGYQTIIDNVSLLDDETVKQLNTMIVSFGHSVYKKKEVAALSLKTDSFVVESNVHFSTDYNLLWDSARKSLDIIRKYQGKHNITGWRKINDWQKDIKNKMRALGQASSSGGKGKEKRVQEVTKQYLTKAKALFDKLEASKLSLPTVDASDMIIFIELNRFMELLSKHIDLLERRVIKGEKIPHSEKMFSIFEEYTEWITKGKKNPSVELGKKVNVTTDQFNLIVDYHVMENQSDSESVPAIAKRMASLYNIASWSFDKGYWKKENKALLTPIVNKVIMPKKGKRNKEESIEEKSTTFKRLRNKHSAIESNINELECRGLDRCPDRSYEHFKRYVSLAVSAYNLRRIGTKLMELEKLKENNSQLKKVA